MRGISLHNPLWGGACLRLEFEKITLASVLASSFVIGVILLDPISFRLFLVDLAGVLVPLYVIFGMYA